jgi:hypothetical protein
MSTALYLDPAWSDDARRQALYGGQLVVLSPTPAARALCELARDLIRSAFEALDPEKAQHSLPVERFAEILNVLKPAFIHHDESKRLLRELLTETGCDPEKTYFDVPRLRSSTSDGYLTTGIAYAWHPHRDTWYSAPSCQLNWWLPVYEVQSENAMAFHLSYFDRGVANSSAGYNYYTWNQTHRGDHVAKLIKSDPRPLPKADGPIEMEPQLRVIPPVGGILLFSGAQMHSSVPNTSGVTRYSIDFRTVNVDDARARRGAPNVDSHCTGTTMRDYLRVSDLSRVPEDVIALYDDQTNDQGALIYQPKST